MAHLMSTAAITVTLSIIAISIGATPVFAEDSIFKNLSEDDQMLFLVDRSGSMDDWVWGKQKIEFVQEAIAALIHSRPSNVPVGLRSFGDNCDASSLLVPISALNSEDIINAVNQLQPNGSTPLGYAIAQSWEDFNPNLEGKKLILLLSAGTDTCSVTPCQVIATMKQAHPDLEIRIDVVALLMDRTAKDRLRCIADLTRGRFLDIGERHIGDLATWIVSGRGLIHRIIAFALGLVALCAFSNLQYNFLITVRIPRHTGGTLTTVTTTLLAVSWFAVLFSSSWFRLILTAVVLAAVLVIALRNEPDEPKFQSDTVRSKEVDSLL